MPSPVKSAAADPCHPQPNRPRGAVIFEAMLSVALFAGAATFALGATKSVFATLDRAKRQQEAVDLVRSKLAELEARMINLADLRGLEVESVGSIQSFGSDALDPHTHTTRWVLSVKTQRTQFTGLTLVELSINEVRGDDQPAGPAPTTVTIRQLMALRDPEVEAYEQDDLLEGLPEVEP